MRNVIDFTQDWRFCKTATVLNILPDWEKVALPIPGTQWTVRMEEAITPLSG